MRWLGHIFNTILYACGYPRPSRPEDIPQKLDSQALQRALAEARFLCSQGVDVAYLATGEKPGIPRAVGEDVSI